MMSGYIIKEKLPASADLRSCCTHNL